MYRACSGRYAETAGLPRKARNDRGGLLPASSFNRPFVRCGDVENEMLSFHFR